MQVKVKTAKLEELFRCCYCMLLIPPLNGPLLHDEATLTLPSLLNPIKYSYSWEK